MPLSPSFPVSPSSPSLTPLSPSFVPFFLRPPPPSCRRGPCRRSTERSPKRLPIIATVIICISSSFVGGRRSWAPLELSSHWCSRRRPEGCISASYIPSLLYPPSPPTHIISPINTVPKNTDAIELLSMPSCIICRSRCKASEVISLLSSQLFLCVASGLFFFCLFFFYIFFFIEMKIFTPYTRLSR